MQKKKHSLRRKVNLSRLTRSRDLVEVIKEKLQYPKLTLELLSELKASRRKNIPQEFIDDALKAINTIEQVLDKLAKR